MSRIYTVEELTRLTLHELHVLYRDLSKICRNAHEGSYEAEKALISLQNVLTAIRLKQAGPKPPGF